MTDTPYDMLKNAATNKCLITSETLKENLADYFILDIRYEADTHEIYIENALKCHWFDVYKLIDNKQLPKSQAIAVICYTGQSSMHVATLLTVLGYEAYSLLDGMSKWL